VNTGIHNGFYIAIIPSWCYTKNADTRYNEAIDVPHLWWRVLLWFLGGETIFCLAEAHEGKKIFLLMHHKNMGGNI
jgi:hypothetical protein